MPSLLVQFKKQRYYIPANFVARNRKRPSKINRPADKAYTEQANSKLTAWEQYLDKCFTCPQEEKNARQTPF